MTNIHSYINLRSRRLTGEQHLQS